VVFHECSVKALALTIPCPTIAAFTVIVRWETCKRRILFRIDLPYIWIAS
jgi:hypothetical protein